MNPGATHPDIDPRTGARHGPLHSTRPGLDDEEAKPRDRRPREADVIMAPPGGRANETNVKQGRHHLIDLGPTPGRGGDRDVSPDESDASPKRRPAVP